MEENFLGELCFQFRFMGRTLRGAWRAIEDIVAGQQPWEDVSWYPSWYLLPPPGQSYIILSPWAPPCQQHREGRWLLLHCLSNAGIFTCYSPWDCVPCCFRPPCSPEQISILQPSLSHTQRLTVFINEALPEHGPLICFHIVWGCIPALTKK